MNTSRRNFLKSAAVSGGIGMIRPDQILKTAIMDAKRTGILFFDVNETLLDVEPLKKSIGGILGNQPLAGAL